MVGGIGARRAPEDYDRLNKPAWAPPACLFGPSRRQARVAIGLHVAQLVCNAAWPVVFFSARDKRASIAIIASLDVLVASEMVVAARTDGVAAGLLAPYLTWCLFATALNVAVDRPAREEQHPSSNDQAS